MTADLLAPAGPSVRATRGSTPLGVGVALAGIFLILLVLVIAFPQWFTSLGPLDADPLHAFAPPGRFGILGNDQLGRDVYTRILYGARESLLIGVAATALGVVVGVLVGLIAGLGGRLTDEVSTRALDVVSAFPGILLAIVLITIAGRGVPTLILALALWSVPRYARLVRADTLLVRRSGHVEQAVTLGLPPLTLVWRHIAPHALAAIPILATLGLGSTILASSGLSFLGLGAQPPSPEWGAMLAEGRNYLANAWWISVFPGIAIVAVVLSVSTAGRFLQRRAQREEGR